MKQRSIHHVAVSELGLGCMNINHAYEPKLDRAQSQRLLAFAFDLGITHFDTAALYGFGVNEEWVGEAIKPFRSKLLLASKCGMTGVKGRRVIDGRPEVITRTCHDALRRLQVDHIDLYYLHRWDKRIPIEESVGAMADLVHKGLITAIGLSEVSVTTLKKAHAVHPIAAVQNEYSLWTRDPELALLEACRDLKIALVAFSPLGRGFLAGSVNENTQFAANDIRATMPRFQSPHKQSNLRLMVEFNKLAASVNCTAAQLALAWLLNRAPHVLPIFGTTSVSHLHENVASSSLHFSADVFANVDSLFNGSLISGGRYPAEVMLEVDTEENSGIGVH